MSSRSLGNPTVQCSPVALNAPSLLIRSRATRLPEPAPKESSASGTNTTHAPFAKYPPDIRSSVGRVSCTTNASLGTPSTCTVARGAGSGPGP